MNKIIQFPGGEGGERRRTSSLSLQMENRIAALKEFYERAEREGRSFKIDWRKLLLAQKELSHLRPPERSRESRLSESYDFGSWPDDAIINLFNNSNEMEWAVRPVYWIAVYNTIYNRKLNEAEK
jgi:hypothetical protein